MRELDLTPVRAVADVAGDERNGLPTRPVAYGEHVVAGLGGCSTDTELLDVDIGAAQRLPLISGDSAADDRLSIDARRGHETEHGSGRAGERWCEPDTSHKESSS